eukprot:CAMPEP_0204299882 /NCGR_PEP_ID=MMETSP0468-20130131/77573_1 /ASSEMBLY_ACC=CAM_ASM_000383 /TAXON_ID=2969 /ORGANISM="Oxyrrhis marina" /LENGTH=42 /DNA_ID= /DNA_START= /DNA_END= /DNA_ORIENTATION=
MKSAMPALSSPVMASTYADPDLSSRGQTTEALTPRITLASIS